MVEITRISLDRVDRVILAELDKNCRIPVSRLAKLARTSRQNVEYRINSLVEKGVITGFNVTLNPHKAGYKIYKLYLQLKDIPEEKKKLLRYLRKSGIVFWMSECHGAWDLILGIYVRSDYDFYELKNHLLSRYGDFITNKDWSILLDIKQYPKMYFTNGKARPTMFAGEVVHNKMEKTDHAILAEMANNARIPLTTLASRVNSTPEEVAERLKRMKELGIIVQYRIGVDLDKLGLRLYKVIINLDKHTKEAEKALDFEVHDLPR